MSRRLTPVHLKDDIDVDNVVKDDIEVETLNVLDDIDVEMLNTLGVRCCCC